MLFTFIHVLTYDVNNRNFTADNQISNSQLFSFSSLGLHKNQPDQKKPLQQLFSSLLLNKRWISKILQTKINGTNLPYKNYTMNYLLLFTDHYVTIFESEAVTCIIINFQEVFSLFISG